MESPQVEERKAFALYDDRDFEDLDPLVTEKLKK